MFTKQKKLALIVSLLGTIIVFSSLTSSVNAQGWNNRNCMGGMNWGDGWQWNDNVPQKYQLSAEQMTSIREIRSQYDDQIFPLQKELRSLRMEARGYASRSDAEIGKIKSYRKDINNLGDKIEDLRLEARTEVNKVLTKEQRVYFGDNFGWWDMDGGMMGMMGDGMGMHDMCR
jgi:Spy/CpxP family protein refolding chaperone